MTDKARRAKGSLWGDLDESKRVAREIEDVAKAGREAKTRELRAKRLARNEPSPAEASKADSAPEKF